MIKVKVKSIEKLHKIRIGIVNMKIDERYSLSNMLNNYQYINLKRKFEMHNILNQAIKNKCNIVVFPEISVPWQWTNMLRLFSIKTNIGIVCGLEHRADDEKNAYNYSLTILPCVNSKYQIDCFVDRRLKIHYSPEEKKLIKGRYYKIPNKDKSTIRLYSWKGLNFTVFNCFELADIELRAQFRGNVDFVVAIEHNPDIDYFSSIIESTSRDLHTFVIQVNSSNFGDSRITQPASSFRKDIVRIKGGENSILIVQDLDIKALRRFQSLNDRLQEENSVFKRTPPDFEIEDKRIDLNILPS